MVAYQTQKIPNHGFGPAFVCRITTFSVALSFIPNVMPVTIMAVMVGSKFGAQRGISFAILVTLASNAVLAWLVESLPNDWMGLGCGCRYR